jgi:allophanate hydrolase
MNAASSTPLDVLGWSISDHLDARRSGVSARAALDAALEAMHELALDDPAVIIGDPLVALARRQADELDAAGFDPTRHPLHGVPFVVKDNIDVAGVPTTCASPSFDRLPVDDATVVARLRAAGAIPIAKTNLDQFATGLVGTRSPYGTPRNPIDASLVPGGSSSGSAVAVARGVVPFSLGTDTAGSGRVPASMCDIVGLKPTVGRLPLRGVVPAVARIDCVSVFARSVGDARIVADIAAGPESGDPWSRSPCEPHPALRRLGVASAASLNAIESVMDITSLNAYRASVDAARDAGFAVIDIDIAPLLEAGALLYGGAFVAERTTAVGDAIDGDGADPTVRTIIAGGRSKSAVDAYTSEYRLAELRTRIAPIWTGPDGIDGLLLPTIPRRPTVAEVAEDPIGANARIGTFTTFANLLDLCVIAVGNLSVIAPGWSDDAAADVAAMLAGESSGSAARPVVATGARSGEMLLTVVGAHLSGMALHHQLSSRHARLVATTTTAPIYRLFALAGTMPPKPGLQRVSAVDGAAIAVEIWALAPSAFASFVAEIPPPLGIGTVELADGSRCSGFICEPAGFDGATDITEFGGWRAYIAHVNAKKEQSAAGSRP